MKVFFSILGKHLWIRPEPLYKQNLSLVDGLYDSFSGGWCWFEMGLGLKTNLIFCMYICCATFIKSKEMDIMFNVNTFRMNIKGLPRIVFPVGVWRKAFELSGSMSILIPFRYELCIVYLYVFMYQTVCYTSTLHIYLQNGNNHFMY